MTMNHPGKHSANHSGHDGAAPLAAANSGSIYTCPMHAEIKQPAPGSCPICGMTLVRAAPTQVGVP